MASREQIASVLLADIYAVGFSSAKTHAQNLSLMTAFEIVAIKRSIETEDLLDVIVPTEIVGMTPAVQDAYMALMFPVFERSSIRRSSDPLLDHRILTKGILSVKNILDAANQANKLDQTVINYAAFIQETTTVNFLTSLGKLKSIQEAMDYLDQTNPGWGI